MISYSPTIEEELMNKIRVLNEALDKAEKKIEELQNQASSSSSST